MEGSGFRVSRGIWENNTYIYVYRKIYIYICI